MRANRSPFQWVVVLGVTAAAMTLLTTAASAGPKGTITVRPLGTAKITIDGDVKDWPLDKFAKVAEQPVFPEAQQKETSTVTGDHMVFDARRIGRFNNTPEAAFTTSDNDFGSSLYLAYDSQYLYMLGVFIDDVLRDDRDTSDFGGQPYFNDGWEFFLHPTGDATGCRGTQDKMPLQFGISLNSKYKPNNSADDVLGARLTLIVGDADQMGPGAGQPGNVLQDALDAIAGPHISARKYADLRAAGARNPELAAKPNVKFAGYVIELRIPFGAAGSLLADFKPDHAMDFEVFWRDTDLDDDSNAGAINVKWASWAQGTTDQCNDDNLKESLLNTSNWGRMVFDTANPLGQ